MTVLRPIATLNSQFLHTFEVQASSATPWRTARIKAQKVPDTLLLRAGYTDGLISPVFQASDVDDQAADWRGQSAGALVRGLGAWRKEVGPKGFQDVHLETLLRWLAAECGGQLDLNVKGKPLRHYQLRRVPAHVAVREALRAWRVEATLLELDGEILHIGPHGQTPHARAGVKAVLSSKVNILRLRNVGDGRALLDVTGMAWLRIGHHVEVHHPEFSGHCRIGELQHAWGDNAVSSLEVWK